MDKHRVLQIGAGAMGSRRLRDLRERGYLLLAVYDQRVDRAVGAHKRFGVRTFGSLQEGLAWKPSVLIVSTPRAPSVSTLILLDKWTYGAALRSDSREGVISTSSASLKFLPLVRGLADLVRQHVGRS